MMVYEEQLPLFLVGRPMKDNGDLIALSVAGLALALVIYLLTFGITWSLLALGLFVSCIVLLFSGAIGPALACLLLSPIAISIGVVIRERRERAETIRRFAEERKQRASASPSGRDGRL